MGFIRWFEEVSLDDVASVGGKLASLGELIRELGPQGVRVPAGFAVTADGYRHFLRSAGLETSIRDHLTGLLRSDVDDLALRAARIRALIESAPLPRDLEDELRSAYRALSERSSLEDADVAVRSSATAEDLSDASLGGQHVSYLDVRGEERLLECVRRCFASLFTARAMACREDLGRGHLDVALSVGVQKMVRADLASSGVLFTLDPESGHPGVVLLTASFGLGQAAVQGQAEPDQFLVHKESLRKGHRSLIRRSIACKPRRLVYADGQAGGVKMEEVPTWEQRRPSLSDDEALQLARWALLVEEHCSRKRGRPTPLDIEWAKDGLTGQLYLLQARPVQREGPDRSAVAWPRTRMMLNVADPEQALKLSQLPSDGVGLLRMELLFASTVRVHPLALTRYSTLPHQLMVEVDRATRGYPDKCEFFVDKLSQAIGVIAAAFHPRPVILRLSDFKSNEYASLVGGKHFEPVEENPMIGWRGASRYYHPDYKDGFLLEVAAIKRVRERFGLDNLKVMVPFCRTPDEGRRVLEVLREGGLITGRKGVEVYAMAELPANVLLADDFAQIFDGFSIGSSDLTQLILGVDRDSALVAPLFDEGSPAVHEACARIIRAAHLRGKKVGICGQAPGDFPDFAFLVEQGIDSISLDADALLQTAQRVRAAEQAGEPSAPEQPAGKVLHMERRRGGDRRRGQQDEETLGISG